MDSVKEINKIDDAIDKFEDDLEKLLDAANLNLPIKIKGLDTLDVSFDNFLADLQTLEINIDLETPSMALKAFDLQVFEDSLKTCQTNKMLNNG
jgi:hypothetical protein